MVTSDGRSPASCEADDALRLVAASGADPRAGKHGRHPLVELFQQSMRLLKSTLPPQVKGPIRELVNHARGLTTTPMTHEEIARLIGRSDPTILEIGCNDGSDTLKFLRVMPQATIYCFEPDPRAVARFKKQLDAQFDRVKLFEIAIGGRTGQVDFHVSSGGDSLPEGWDYSGSIRRPKNHLTAHPWVKFEKTITVSACRLDDWCAENGVKQVDFIWMDVQGAERDVFAGGQKILQETKFLYTEYSNNELYEGQLPLKSLLSQLPSFDVVARYPEDVLLRNRKLT